jgi:hypothetical protein
VEKRKGWEKGRVKVYKGDGLSVGRRGSVKNGTRGRIRDGKKGEGLIRVGKSYRCEKGEG